jgi:hypothetical protein
VIELPSEAIGFHGTSRDAVAHLLARDIRPSDQHFEWLGTGLYLWQDSPWRAQQWAEARYGADAAVVVARVDLEGCLDLLNPSWQVKVADADFEFAFECITSGVPIPVNTDHGNHARDAATINFYCDRVAADGGLVRSVRAIFEEGEPIFEASKIRSQSHVQIAVRDLTAILQIEEVTT